MKEKVKMYYHMQKYAFLMPSMFFFLQEVYRFQKLPICKVLKYIFIYSYELVNCTVL